MGAVFGTTEQLIGFAKIFLGTLLVAGLCFAVRHFRGGLALPGSQRFDRTVLLLGLWCFAGMVIDAWAHKNGTVEDSFFTPWHAVWYSGFAAFSSYITFALWRLHEGGLPRSVADIKEFLGGMPAGYRVGVLGMIVFAVSGFGDMLWHTFFGIEGGTDILLSPTHLGLAAGLALTLMTPVMAAWNDPDSGRSGLGSQIFVLFGIGAALSVITLFTSFAHHQTMSYWDLCAIVSGCQAGSAGLETGVSAILLQSLILSGAVLFFIKRWKPVFGSFTVMLGVNGVAIAAFAPSELREAWQHLIAPLLGGFIIDLAHSRWGHHIRLFAFSVPALHTIVWMLVVTAAVGFQITVVGGDIIMSPLGWSIHATVGAVFLAGCMGLLVSILTDPPRLPESMAD